MADGLFVNRWNLLAVLACGVALVVGHVFVPHWSTRYGSYLVVFSVWMAWFVVTGVRLIDRLDR